MRILQIEQLWMFSSQNCNSDPLPRISQGDSVWGGGSRPRTNLVKPFASSRSKTSETPDSSGSGLDARASLDASEQRTMGDQKVARIHLDPQPSTRISYHFWEASKPCVLCHPGARELQLSLWRFPKRNKSDVGPKTRFPKSFGAFPEKIWGIS